MNFCRSTIKINFNFLWKGGSAISNISSEINKINAGGILQTANAYYTPTGGAGWYRVARVHIYSSFVIYTIASWDTGAPCNGVWTVCSRGYDTNTVSTSRINAAYNGAHATHMRVTRATGNYNYIEFYDEQATSSRMNVIMIGHSLDDISQVNHPTSPISGSPTVIGFANSAPPIIRIHKNIGTVSIGSNGYTAIGTLMPDTPAGYVFLNCNIWNYGASSGGHPFSVNSDGQYIAGEKYDSITSVELVYYFVYTSSLYTM